LVLGGSALNRTHLGYLSSVEVIEEPPSDENCQLIEPYPLELIDATSIYYDGKIRVCGGAALSELDFSLKDCYELASGSSQWQEMQSLPIGRHLMESSIIDDKWFLTGGENNAGGRTRTWVYENGIFTPGPELPITKTKHCQLTLNETHIFFAGGNTLSTFILNWPEQEWILLGNTLGGNSLQSAACGLLKNADLGQGNSVQ